MFGKHKEKIAEPTLQSRQKVMWLHPTSLIAFMKSLRWVIVNNHLPADAAYHHMFWDPQRQVYGVVCVSSEWPPVFIGQTVPELPPVEFRFFDPAIDGKELPNNRPGPDKLGKAEGGA